MKDTYASAQRLFALVSYLSSTHSAKIATKQDIFAQVTGYPQSLLAAERMLERDFRFLERQGFEVKKTWNKREKRRGYQLINASDWFSRVSYLPAGKKGTGRRPANNLLAVLEMLKGHRWVKLTGMCQDLAVSRATIERYISVLRRIGVPIQERNRPLEYRLRPGTILPNWQPEQVQAFQQYGDSGESLRRFLFSDVQEASKQETSKEVEKFPSLPRIRQMVKSLLQDHPEWNDRQIAEQIGCHYSYVSLVRRGKR